MKKKSKKDFDKEREARFLDQRAELERSLERNFVSIEMEHVSDLREERLTSWS